MPLNLSLCSLLLAALVLDANNVLQNHQYEHDLLETELTAHKTSRSYLCAAAEKN